MTVRQTLESRDAASILLPEGEDARLTCRVNRRQGARR